MPYFHENLTDYNLQIQLHYTVASR